MTSVSRDGVVEFRFYRPRVRQVSVVGDFNGWRKDALHMTAEGNGWWRAELQLQQGDYRFRYLADDIWFADFASHGVES
ncbi:MAG TPA: glycogen-binding domain-containing protein, partial [Tepidisphaeraceae bacterium]|nr:glycogen-binding domain-containing protein [Tepidisphaeraceae bacterium]